MGQIINYVINNYPSTSWILLFFSGIFLLAIRKQIEIFYLNMFRKIASYLKRKFRSHVFTRKDLFRENKIQELLLSLRLENDADRTNVFIFHNGGVFSCDLPQFKISKTHESIKAGISSTFKQDQDIRCSSIIDIIKPLWVKDDPAQGIKFAHASPPHGTLHICDQAYYVVVDELSAGFAKSSFNEKGVKYAIMTPLRGTKGQVIGFCSLEYCNEINMDGLLTECLGLCQIASDICFYLNQVH
jgi:hypothetical protein